MDKSDLHNYQLTACDHIIHTYYCGLLMDMGLGKTVSTLTAINYLIYEDLEIDSVLIVAPKRVVETVWAEECENFSHLNKLSCIKIIGNEKQRLDLLKKKANLYIISRDNIAWLCDLYKKSLAPFDMLVIDELSSFKSAKSKRFKALKTLRPQFKRVVGLTGSPVPNGLIDLWSQMYLLDRGQRLEKTITKYRALYFDIGKTNGTVVFNYVLKPFAEEVIHNKISDICISMSSKDYLELPERVDNFIRIKMPAPIAKQYRDFENEKILELLGNTDGVTAVNAAVLSNKLLQFAGGAVYDDNKNVHKIHDLKLEAIDELLDSIDDKPILIAWTYRHEADRLKEHLIKYKPRELQTAQDITDWNAGKIKIALAHPASIGHGLNLQTGGSTIIWYSLNWSLELYQQFNARLLRQGQTNTVIIHHLIMSGTHDEDVLRALRTKDKTQNSLILAIKAKIEQYENDFRFYKN